MKYLIQMAFTENATPETVAPYQNQSAKELWSLYLGDTIREMYVRADQRGIVFIAESNDLADLTEKLNAIPLVSQGLLNGQIVRLMPFQDLALAFVPTPREPALQH
jgi:hypothetical protein